MHNMNSFIKNIPINNGTTLKTPSNYQKYFVEPCKALYKNIMDLNRGG